MILGKVKAVKRVFEELEFRTGTFVEVSKIKCISGCSHCCRKSSILATVLEFLPAAEELVRTGSSDKILETLDSRGEDGTCVFYNPFIREGGCSVYENRGLICRLFGFSARLHKDQKLQLISCNLIKESVTPGLSEQTLKKAPLMSDYYLKLYGIDPELATRYQPINTAIQKAIELVAFHFQFRRPRKAS